MGMPLGQPLIAEMGASPIIPTLTCAYASAKHRRECPNALVGGEYGHTVTIGRVRRFAPLNATVWQTKST